MFKYIIDKIETKRIEKILRIEKEYMDKAIVVYK